MEYKILNDKNRKYMMDGINNNLNFEWEDSHLINQIIRKIDDIYPYSSDPQEFIDDKYFLNEINKLFKLFYRHYSVTWTVNHNTKLVEIFNFILHNITPYKKFIISFTFLAIYVAPAFSSSVRLP